MSQVLKCPHCGAAMKVPDEMTGKQLGCPFCKGVFATPGTAAPVSRICPSCKAPLLPGAISCMDCGHLLKDGEKQAVQKSPSPVAPVAAIVLVALPADPVATLPLGTRDHERRSAWIGLLPALLLLLILGGLMVRDVFTKAEDSGVDQAAGVAEENKLLDPDPRIRVQFDDRALDNVFLVPHGTSIAIKSDDKPNVPLGEAVIVEPTMRFRPGDVGQGQRLQQ